MKTDSEQSERPAGFTPAPGSDVAPESDILDDPEYQKWLIEMAEHCRCTPMSERPCAGVCAGGLCDDLHWDDPYDAPEQDW